MTNTTADAHARPALFRAGDIGVASEWRDISYDWSPILTPDGVFIYSYLRDTYDQQRNLRPFLLTPEGPTKKSIQVKLGLKSAYAMQGPEYLLCTVGLLHVELGYGASTDPERPNHTHVAYYVVGRLDQPVLDWTTLAGVLDALLIALDAPSPVQAHAVRQKQATAALRSLGQAGLLQDCDPADLFYPFGAWPSLLATLIQDERWVALFNHLHGPAAIPGYRQQARAWIEYAQRTAMRLMQDNQAIGDQLLAAQRRGPRRGGSPGGGPPIPAPAAGSSVGSSQIPVTSARKPGEVTLPGLVTGASLARHQPLEVTITGSVTPRTGTDANDKQRAPASPAGESLLADQLTLSSGGEEGESLPLDPWTPGGEGARDLDTLPLVEPHLRDAELTTTRFDATFWCAVNQILYQTNARYDAGAGEKQAVFRQFKRKAVPVGVVLAALRAVMTLPPPHRPPSFNAALKLITFHACVQQGLALLPVRAAAMAESTWPHFLAAYRRLGQTNGLRDVTTSDYHVLYALFAKQPQECWDVLNRVEHAAHTPALSPAYLRRAIVNNQRVAAQQALLPTVPRGSCPLGTAETPTIPARTMDSQTRPPDPRHVLLVHEGVPLDVLKDDMTEDYIRAWIAAAEVCQEGLFSRPRWLTWGITSGYLPTNHPQLRARLQRSARTRPQPRAPAHEPAEALAAAPTEDPRLRALWHAALHELEDQCPAVEIETWIKPCQLVAFDPSTSQGEPARAIIAAPNVFVRQEVETRYHAAIAGVLSVALTQAVSVQVVIDS